MSVTTNDVLFEAFGPNTCYNPVTNTTTPDWICIGPQPGSPNPAVPFQTYGANPTATPPFNIFGVVRDLKTPRIQYYSMTLQHELFSKNAISIGYFGAYGTDMLLNRMLNQRPVGCFAAGSQLRSGTCARPFATVFPDFKYVNQLTNDGFSRYNSMQVTYRQRDWHGLNSIVNFTWSNCIDTNSVNRGGGATLPISLNPYKPDSNRGPCDTDIRRNFNTGINYDFPKWSALGRLGSGWQMDSVASYAGGLPFPGPSPLAFSHAAPYSNFPRPPALPLPSYQYSDPNANMITNPGAVFGLPADGTLGSCGRNAFRGPHFVQWDVNLNKATKITERLSIQLRWEIFNVLNHPTFNSFPSCSTLSSA